MGEKKKTDKGKIVPWILVGVLFLALLAVFTYTNYKEERSKPNCCKEYVGSICIDKDSLYYGCSVKDEMCSENYLKISKAISILEAGKVKIYGRAGCGWCAKQLAEFGSNAEYLKERGIYVDCESSGDEMCGKITSTPSWVKDGQVIHEGYVPLSDLLEGE